MVINSAPVVIPSGVGTLILFDTISFQTGTEFLLQPGGIIDTGAATFVMLETQVFIDENATGTREVVPIPGVSWQFAGVVGGGYSPRQLLTGTAIAPTIGAAAVEVAQNSGVDLTIAAFDAYLQIAGW